ncbi:MAG: hypothetical protein KatS3mg105_2882 [Gemmatales bacterium]|nr:MAG: hypothetical protein KatS3mg105_2882 [Gemmatales bacterium]
MTSAWLTLRQVQAALKNGRLEEAVRLIGQPEVQGHKHAADLLQKIGQAYVARGERSLEVDQIAKAWHDLLQAEQLGILDARSLALRQELAKRSLREGRRYLEAGEPGRAAEVFAQLRSRGVESSELALWHEAAKSWQQARDAADHGEFALAAQSAKRVADLLGNEPSPLKTFRREVEENRTAFMQIISELHEAAEASQWRKVLELSEKALALAPLHAAARKARTRAWQVIEAPTVALESSQKTPVPPDEQPSSQRLMLWVDGVGGYLICLDAKVSIGQAAPDGIADIPLFADISRRHAWLTRDVEGYLLEAERTVQINGQAVERTLLRPGDRVTLGKSCQFQFLQPVPISATARLDMVSGHRLPLAVEKVILMAETLVLGRGPQVHIEMDIEKPVILYRQKEGLGIRYAGKLNIDGNEFEERGSLTTSSQVRGDDFAFALELVGRHLK